MDQGKGKVHGNRVNEKPQWVCPKVKQKAFVCSELSITESIQIADVTDHFISCLEAQIGAQITYFKGHLQFSDSRTFAFCLHSIHLTHYFFLIYPSIHLFKGVDSSTYEIQSQYWFMKIPSWIRCYHLPRVSYLDKIFKSSDVNSPYNNRSNWLAGTQWHGGKVSKEGFTKQKVLEPGSEGYVRVFPGKLGWEKISSRGNSMSLVSLRSL